SPALDGMTNSTATSGSRNTADEEGGGLSTGGGLATVSGSIVRGNSASSGGGLAIGGGLAEVTVSGSTVSLNLATTQGGGMYSRFGTPTIRGSTVRSNPASVGAGR